MKIDKVGLAKITTVCENVTLGAEVDDQLWSTVTRTYEEKENVNRMQVSRSILSFFFIAHYF